VTSGVPTDCLELWPEVIVQGVAGESYTFFEANNDRSACTYTAIPDSLALSWRADDLTGLEVSRSGAALTGEVVDSDVCDAAWFTILQDTILILEAYSESHGRVYNVTMSGFDIANAQVIAEALVGGACVPG
jgi:hypothetical protein